MNPHPNEPPPAYSPPPGPPPSHSKTSGAEASSEYLPPPGPPPSHQNASGAEPPPYPPPPGIAHNFSSGANATEDEAEQAELWCNFYPLTPPFPLPPNQLQLIHSQNHTLLTPPHFKGTVSQLNQAHHTFRLTTTSGCKDTLIQTALPAFSHFADNPLLTERPKTLYYELHIRSIGVPQASSSRHGLFSRQKPAEDSGVAIGFFAPPYPPFRLPGWQRGSIAVHSDDGRRYVGNPNGGMDFTRPFEVGDTLGLGVTFEGVAGGDGPGVSVEVFFTRNGSKAGGWNLLQDTDAEWERVVGLLGENDVFPGVGVFGVVDVDVNFGEGSWLYRGWSHAA